MACLIEQLSVAGYVNLSAL